MADSPLWSEIAVEIRDLLHERPIVAYKASRVGADQLAVLEHLEMILRQAGDVEDQGDPAVTHDRGAGVHRDALELASQRLDDDLLRVVHACDRQTEADVIGLHDDDRHRLTRLLLDAQRAGE